MGGFTGKYSRSPFATYNEEKNYAFALMQEGVPVTDDDENANRLGLYTTGRRNTQLFGNYGSPNDGFRIQEAASTANNFKIVGGGPANTDIEAAGRFFMRGISCVLLHDVDYMNSLSDIAEQSIHPRITNVYYDGTDTVVEDSAANWGTNELQGRTVRIGSTNRAIVSNGQDFFKVSGDHTVGSADPDPIEDLAYYILVLAPPSSGTRFDGVYLNVYLDEYDGDDDQEITKRIGGTDVVAQLRAKVIQTIYVRQDTSTWGELTDYVDSNGNRHYVFKLARILRDTSNAIETADITDYVPTIGFENIGLDKLTALRPSATSPTSNRIYVSPGIALSTNGGKVLSFGGGLCPSMTPVTTNPKWCLVYLGDHGVLNVEHGAEAPSPVKPTVQGVPIAYVYVNETTTVDIQASDIVDARSIFTPGCGITLAHNATFQSQLSDLIPGAKLHLQEYQYSYSISLPYNIPDGVEIDGRNQTIGIYPTGRLRINGDNVTIRNVNFRIMTGSHQTFPESIYVDDTSGVVFENCTFAQSGGDGVAYNDRPWGVRINALARNWRFRNCHFNGFGFLSSLAVADRTAFLWAPQTHTQIKTPTGYMLGDSAAKFWAQKFTVPADKNRIQAFYIRIFQEEAEVDPTVLHNGNVLFEIRNDSGGLPGTTGAGQTIQRMACFANWDTQDNHAMWARFEFVEPVSLSPFTTYWIVLADQSSDIGHVSGWGNVSVGTSFLYSNNGTTWNTCPSVSNLGLIVEWDETDALLDDSYAGTGIIDSCSFTQETASSDLISPPWMTDERGWCGIDVAYGYRAADPVFAPKGYNGGTVIITNCEFNIKKAVTDGNVPKRAVHIAFARQALLSKNIVRFDSVEKLAIGFFLSQVVRSKVTDCDITNCTIGIRTGTPCHNYTLGPGFAEVAFTEISKCSILVIAFGTSIWTTQRYNASSGWAGIIGLRSGMAHSVDRCDIRVHPGALYQAAQTYSSKGTGGVFFRDSYSWAQRVSNTQVTFFDNVIPRWYGCGIFAEVVHGCSVVGEEYWADAGMISADLIHDSTVDVQCKSTSQGQIGLNVGIGAYNNWVNIGYGTNLIGIQAVNGHYIHNNTVFTYTTVSNLGAAIYVGASDTVVNGNVCYLGPNTGYGLVHSGGPGSVDHILIAMNIVRGTPANGAGWGCGMLTAVTNSVINSNMASGFTYNGATNAGNYAWA